MNLFCTRTVGTPIHAAANWPAATGVNVRFHGRFAYVTAVLADGDEQPLMRLRYNQSASIWGFALYRASRDDYQDSTLNTDLPIGSPPRGPRYSRRALFRTAAELTKSTTSR